MLLWFINPFSDKNKETLFQMTHCFKKLKKKPLITEKIKIIIEIKKKKTLLDASQITVTEKG